MKYASPIRLFNEELDFGKQDITERELSLIKRKLLAEAELNDNKTVIRDGIEFSKEDIVQLFDQLGRDTKLNFHQRIFNNKPLLGFLEKGEYDFTGGGIDTTEIAGDEEFKNFIMPWFIPVWLDSLLAMLRDRQYACLLELMQVGKAIIDPPLLAEILSPVEAKLHDLQYQANIAAKSITRGSVNEEELDEYINGFLVSFLNELPYTFGNLRNSYMLVMINITVYLFNTGHKGLARAYAAQAIKLDCDEYYAKQMRERYELYKKRNRSFNWTPGRIVWFVVIGLLQLIRFATSNSGPNTDAVDAARLKYITQYANKTDASPVTAQVFNLFQTQKIDAGISDSARIHWVTADTQNARFLTSLVKLLGADISHLPVKRANPEVPGVRMNTDILQAYLDSNWHDEGFKADGQSDRIYFLNRTSMQLLLLYKNEGRLQVKCIPPGNEAELNLRAGYTMMAPFFGDGWSEEKELYRNDKAGRVLVNKGWFTLRDKQANGKENNTVLLELNDNGFYSDTILFTGQAGLGYQVNISGGHTKKVDRVLL